MKLITEQEAASILRCSTEKVKRLRLSGRLPYIPGRPVKIDEADLLAFIEASKKRGPSSADAVAEGKPKLSAEAWARQAVLKPKRAPRSK
ncbi:helix-turn-helix domain-containing protein [Rhizobium leguminosarum]|nr:helix-turn-helix domain-containing protein [Rhizobium leguminosarum]MBY5860600.1 helix-turn-helix domain-containing protein [Rhizobium leguminosarum]